MAARTVSGLALLMALAAPAGADLADARFRITAEQGEIWLAFDNQPVQAELVPIAGGAELRLRGVEVSERRILPRDPSLVQEIRVEPVPAGAVVRLYGSADWTTARAQLRQSGVLIGMPITAMYAAPPVDFADANDTGLPDAAMLETGMTESGVTDTGMTESGRPMARTDAPATMPTSAPVAASGLPAEDPHGGADMSRPPPGMTSPITNTDDASGASELAARAAAAAEAEARRVEAERAAETEREAEIARSAGTACERAAAAVEESPWDEALQAEHAGCLAGAGDLDGAARIYGQMLAFEPENASAAIALAEIRAAQGDRAAARRLFEQAAANSISDAEAARAIARARELSEQ